ncbi:MAG: hypothetical protein D5R98_06795 [Desulfonatronovibrio sp. MSAO_Bac4]|nr:MAG: hypothetical protein D5R98_06795 [Desulfonatronovibrio sp. MSAO_Bac4]
MAWHGFLPGGLQPGGGLSLASGLSPIRLSETRNAPSCSLKLCTFGLKPSAFSEISPVSSSANEKTSFFLYALCLPGLPRKLSSSLLGLNNAESIPAQQGLTGRL